MSNPMSVLVDKLNEDNRKRYDGMSEIYDLLGGLFRDHITYYPQIPVADAFPAILECIRGYLHEQVMKMIQEQMDTAEKAVG